MNDTLRFSFDEISRYRGPFHECLFNVFGNSIKYPSITKMIDALRKRPAPMYYVFFEKKTLVYSAYVIVIPQYDDINAHEYYNGFIIHLDFDIGYPSAIIPLVIKKIILNKFLFNLTSPAGVDDLLIWNDRAPLP